MAFRDLKANITPARLAGKKRYAAKKKAERAANRVVKMLVCATCGVSKPRRVAFTRNAKNCFSCRDPEVIRLRKLEVRRRIKRRWLENNFAKRAAASKRYVQKNKAYYAEYSRMRKVLQHRATLKLSQAYQAEIAGIYFFCQLFPKFEVDHIVLLKGATVSGLHVPWNLQPATRSENARKGNKLVPEGTRI